MSGALRINQKHKLVMNGPLSVTTIAGVAQSIGNSNGVGTNARFNYVTDISISPDRSFALIPDSSNHLIRRMDLASRTVTTLAGGGATYSAISIGTNAKFSYPNGVTISPDGTFALVGDSNNHLVRRIEISTASVSIVAGQQGVEGAANGVGTFASFRNPTRVGISPDATFVLVSDTLNQLIRRIELSSGSVSTLAGGGMTYTSVAIGTMAKFNWPFGITISADGTFALVADSSNHLLRHIDISTATVSTIAGVQGSSGDADGVLGTSKLFAPNGVDLSPDDAYAWIGDANNNKLRQITLSTGVVTTLAGKSSFGWTNAIGTNAEFYQPSGVAIASNGAFGLVADQYNHIVRLVTLQTASPTLAPTSSPTISRSPTSSPTVVVF
jgi:sugar lactone lactonase YvrE